MLSPTFPTVRPLFSYQSTTRIRQKSLAKAFVLSKALPVAFLRYSSDDLISVFIRALSSSPSTLKYSFASSRVMIISPPKEWKAHPYSPLIFILPNTAAVSSHLTQSSRVMVLSSVVSRLQASPPIFVEASS